MAQPARELIELVASPQLSSHLRAPEELVQLAQSLCSRVHDDHTLWIGLQRFFDSARSRK
jgi:hypothetical protein